MTKRYKMRLDGIFTSNAVFPEGKEIRIFGDGEGTAKVSFCGATAHAVSVGGRWEAVLPAMERGGPYTLELELNGEHTALEGIYIGKVYIFAGQSNMQFKLYESTTSPEACRPSPKMRLFSTDRLEQGEPFCFRDGWVEADRDNIDRWPAIPYLVSEYISEKENVAVGAITCYQGASVIESWVPCGAFKKIGIDIPVSELAPDHTYEKYRIWNGDGYLYSHTFSRIAPYSVNGVIWYQGESDTSVSEGREYAGELEELIRIWRADLHDSELPFAVVQLADLNRRGEGWRLVQEAQAQVGETVKNVKTVISRDVCENDNIHPPTKDLLSKRIAEALI